MSTLHAFFSACLAFAATALGQEVPENPGWTYTETTLSSPATLRPDKETVFYKLVPPTEIGEPVIIGKDLFDDAISSGLPAGELYEYARLMNKKGGAAKKSEDELPTFVPPVTKKIELTGAASRSAPKKEEFLWNLALPKPTPKPLPESTQLPPPPPSFRVVGRPMLTVLEMKKLPKAACVRLKPGEEALIEADKKTQSPTDVEALYRLRRDSDKQFIAELNLRYVRGSDYDGSLKQEEIDPHYRRRVNECLSLYSPAFRDPTSERMLKIVLTKDPTVPQQEIKIGSARLRSSSQHYERDANCAVILHEMSHLLGLVDEYDDPGFVPRAFLETELENTTTLERHKQTLLFQAPSDCRAISPRASLMNWHEEAAENSLQPKVKVERCFCEKNTNCAQLAKASDGKACPKGTTPFSSMQEVKLGEEFHPAPDDAKSFVLRTNYAETVGKGSPGRSSLLYPAQFRAITEPGCEDVNWKYYACARNAYRFSAALPEEWDIYGLQRLDYQGCLPDPADCRSGYEWLK